MGETSLAQIEAVRRYEEKNYRKIMFQLRQDEDSEIIKSIDEAKEHGITKRVWLSELFYAKPSAPDDMVSIAEVEKTLAAFRVENADAIIDEIKRRG